MYVLLIWYNTKAIIIYLNTEYRLAKTSEKYGQQINNKVTTLECIQILVI